MYVTCILERFVLIVISSDSHLYGGNVFCATKFNVGAEVVLNVNFISFVPHFSIRRIKIQTVIAYI